MVNLINPVTPASSPPSTPWFAAQALGEGITHIFEPGIFPFYRCNVWHVRGRDGCLLLDSGLGSVSLSAELPWLHETPLIAVASHAHFDHIGNHHEFAERACHASEADILAAPDPERTLATRFAVLEMFERLPPGGFDPGTYRVLPAPATRLLEHGDVIDLGDRHFEVLHVPGHSPGSIALWERASGVLFSGDALYDGPLLDDAYHSNRDDYVESLCRLRELPVNVVHGGHFPSFDRHRFHQLIDEYLLGRRAPGCPQDPHSHR